MTLILAFDEGPGAGLGHRRRIEALTAELDARGHQCELVSLADAPDTLVIEADLLVVDSYRVRADDEDRFRAPVVIAIDDLGRDLAVDIVVDPSPGAVATTHARAGRVLTGGAYALVPFAATDARPALVDESVARVLVTMGAADSGGIGAEVAAAVVRALPSTEVRLVVGPWGAGSVPAGVIAVDRPDGLAGELADAGIVVTAGGVTMLEACRLGRPIVALALAPNQEQAVAGLAYEGAVVWATPANAADEVEALALDRGRRLALVTNASAAIDGKGAMRVADAIEQLVSR